jgi:Cu-processing system permease protein
MRRILKYVALDILKNKIVIAYAIMLALLSWSSFTLEDNAAKGVLTLLNIILLTVPLVSVLFATIYVYNSNEFIELLASHPVNRGMIWKALFTGLSLSLSLAFLIGTGLPVLIFAPLKTAITMIVAGVFITIIFVAIAFLSSILSRDKAKGIGIAILLWLYFALLFDGLILFILFQFADYPIEKLAVTLSALSPIDLCRIVILMQLDVSAMMGYTGAVFQKVFGSGWGLIITLLLLTLWMAIPFYISLYKFKRKNL